VEAETSEPAAVNGGIAAARRWLVNASAGH
jgi:hypothetical protein